MAKHGLEDEGGSFAKPLKIQTMNSALEIKSVQKSYGSLIALHGIDLEIPQGEFFGLLGPNGAGKTTLIGSIMGLVRPDEGNIFVFQNPVWPDGLEARKYLGFSPQEMNVDRFFNVQKTLEFQAGFYDFDKKTAKARTEEMLKQFNLKDKAKVQFYKLSGGMQRRLLIARAMMSQPKILILDEPSAGIDVEQRHELWNYLRNLNKGDTTIILTTHYIDEAEALCERVAIIHQGRIIEMGNPHELMKKHSKNSLEDVFIHMTGSKIFEIEKKEETQGSTHAE